MDIVKNSAIYPDYTCRSFVDARGTGRGDVVRGAPDIQGEGRLAGC